MAASAGLATDPRTSKGDTTGPGDTRVFVYGTLKAGHANHGPLEGAELIGRGYIEGNFTLVDLGFYPGVVKIPGNETNRVWGEVYRVSPTVLGILDTIEGHPHFYKREKLTTSVAARTWVYMLPNDYETRGEHVEAGCWKPSEEEKKHVADSATPF